MATKRLFSSAEVAAHHARSKQAWRDRRGLGEMIEHNEATLPHGEARSEAPKQDTGTPGQVCTYGETGFSSYVSVAA